MAKHRVLSPDRFVDKFQGNEQLLRDFVRLWGDGLNVKVSSLDVPGFKRLIEEGDWHRKDEFLEELHRVYDLCTDRGHEDLFAACRDSNYEPDPDGTLPVELLSLKVRTENEDAFNLAYDRCTLRQAQRFSIYQGKKGLAIANIGVATKRLQAALADTFKGDKHSDRVLVRQYQDSGYTNFVVYHEQRTKSLLVFKGTKADPKIAPTVLRPAQQDFVSYHSATGQAEFEARYQSEETALRKRFAECCFGDADLFERPEAATRFTLAPIADADFSMPVDDGDSAALVELHFSLKQRHGPTFVVKSKDVFDTLEFNHLRKRLSGDQVWRAVFKITFPDDRRGKRVELSGTNKISFNRQTHAEDVFRYLKNWGILLG
ncbi:MAG: hypothetical protein FJW34_07940 [Acidobacteria bacterium]|nr:hypothetical protein [Acidobacteriota bacterium]